MARTRNTTDCPTTRPGGMVILYRPSALALAETLIVSIRTLAMGRGAPNSELTRPVRTAGVCASSGASIDAKGDSAPNARASQIRPIMPPPPRASRLARGYDPFHPRTGPSPDRAPGRHLGV